MAMVILGLGSNSGDRVANMRNALNCIKQIPNMTVAQVSPIYLSDALLPENAPAKWNLPFLNLAIRCDTTVKPLELLEYLKKIEIQLGRDQIHDKWSPRTIDIDILAYDNLTMNTDVLTIPHKHLLERPFALWPLADVAPFWEWQGKTSAQLVEPLGSRFSGDAPFHTRPIYQRIDIPELVGIINVTPDSFADGGKFMNVDRAIQQAMHLVYSGATVLDIGAESTAPTSAAIDSNEEWTRLEPVLDAVTSIKSTLFLTPKISVDTRHPDVAEKALQYGIDWINDVTGLDNPIMRAIIASSHVDCVFMHHMSIPERRDNVLPRNQNTVELVYAWGANRINELEKQGISRERIIFDPGIGFGKMAEQSLLLLQQVSTFSKLGTRVLVGHSRKTYLSNLTDQPFSERDIETTAVSMYLAKQPINYMRLHNVEICARALRVEAVL